ncbi:cytochrome c551 [Bacillus solimangrovi]|uniref:Cytochrome C551 n=1 Tax=Bacillus solimangrovi TaxID=1305675 RepID=A0A1E5LDP4_9BACI|nr:cytochrome c [Bacillus solimangrovi]OEH92213.1 cytochrome C551 [Bacillus solimangrovi]
MKKKLLTLFMGTALVLSACGGGEEVQEPVQEPEVEQPAGDEGAVVDTAGAEKLYQESCVSCHGQNLEGGVGPELTAVGASLSSEEILNIITNGQGSMPAGLLQGAEAEKVAAWLAEKK